MLCYVALVRFFRFLCFFSCFFFASFTLYFYLHCAQRRYFITRSHEEFSAVVFSFLLLASSSLCFLSDGMWVCVWVFDFRSFRGFYFDSTTLKTLPQVQEKTLSFLFFTIYVFLFQQTFLLPTFRRLERRILFPFHLFKTRRVRNANEVSFVKKLQPPTCWKKMVRLMKKNRKKEKRLKGSQYFTTN